MSPRARARRAVARIVRFLLVAVAAALVVAALALLLFQTGWAKERVRRLVVRQANQYLNASLAIGHLGGSLVRGIELDDVRLARDGQTLVAIDRVSLAYSIRDLVQHARVIRELRLVRPEIHAARTEGGGWNLAGLVRPTGAPQRAGGPPRPLEIESLAIVDGTVRLSGPVTFGAVHAPSDMEHLNASLAVDFEPPVWHVTLRDLSWKAPAAADPPAIPGLTVTHMSGRVSVGPGGLTFRDYSVETPTSAFTLDGTVDRSASPTRLDLDVHASRFDFPAWGSILPPLSKIGVQAGFDVTLRGPVRHLETTLDLRSTGGSVRGTLVLNTTVPGWHGQGTLRIGALNLARWLSNPEKPSDITGTVTFNLALELGHHFPRGTYVFDGPHASFMGYGADNVRARGTITAREALVRQASARAYGADVTVGDGAIGIDTPYPYRFAGTLADLDLRRVPPSVPVPHVESTLALDYDVHGRFHEAYIAGRARFAPSTFLGARLGDGMVGTIDTSITPIQYAGDGDVSDFDITRVGRGLGVAWMEDPRYAGTLDGHFQMEAAGTDSLTLALRARGRIARARLFSGTFAGDQVSLRIADGTLATTFEGPYRDVDPAAALDDPRFRASLTGSADLRVTVTDLLRRSPGLLDYDIDGSVSLDGSTIRGVDVTSARLEGRLADGVTTLSRAAVSGPALQAHGAGVVSWIEERPSDFEYVLNRVDLATAGRWLGQSLDGTLSTTGRATGPWVNLHVAGDGTLQNAAVPHASATAASAHYDVSLPGGRLREAAAALQGRVSFATVGGVPLETVHGTVTFANQRAGFDLDVTQAAGRQGTLSGAVVLQRDQRRVLLRDLTVGVGGLPWRLTAAAPPPALDWSGPGVVLSPITLIAGTAVAGQADAGSERTGSAGSERPRPAGEERTRPTKEGTEEGQQVTIGGSWGAPGGGLHVTARNVRLESLEGAFAGPTRYGGTVNLDATIRGTHNEPIVTGRVRITDGRVARLTYDAFEGDVQYHDDLFDIAFRLDQAPGVYLRADGTVPLALFDPTLAPRRIDVTVTSTPIDFGLIEGITGVVRDVTGRVRIDARAEGTSRNPQFSGAVGLADAAFLVTATGVRYQHVQADFQLAPDRIAVRTLHVEDSEGHALDATGSLATHQLTIGAVMVDLKAQDFDVLHNTLGQFEADATLAVRGTIRLPRVSGQVSLRDGVVRVDQVMNRLLFQPYSTTAVNPSISAVPALAPGVTPSFDALAALNPWDRLALAIDLRVPETLRLTGQDIQVTPGTPIGLGSINLRTGGDLWLIKDAGQPLGVYGSLDSLSGTYVFQGRQFELQPGSSINFRGDLTPEVYVTVAREISGVQARVTITGALNSPELQLSSTPPLDPSDVLSLVVFGTTTNQLNVTQQQELAVRAGALAAGFLATPIIAALERSLGIDLLEIEPSGEFGTGPRVTIGQELAPGLVARFSRQFGQDQYDQAVVEYYLSRILRIRATFSDAASINARSPFRRLERAGIDLIFFFSY